MQHFEEKTAAKPSGLTEKNQKELSDMLNLLFKKCQKELSAKLLECYQHRLSTWLPGTLQKKFSDRLSQLYKEPVEELSFQIEPRQQADTCPISCADVIVILGHSSVFSCGPFDTEELLVALTKLSPTIIAFLSCCGGNTRYGPIYKMSHLLTPKSVIGFYQRRVYVDELCETSLVRGLRYYMYLQRKFTTLGKEESETSEETDKIKRLTAIQAFGCAQHSLDRNESDPTVLVNDYNELNFAEILYETVENKGGKIPLSSLQFAMYYHMVVSSDMCPINISMKSVAIAKNFKELDGKSISEIRRHKIQELIPLILELGLSKLCNESLDLIKCGDQASWRKVDHLQFLLAMLRGHWGKNSLNVIREWATFHLMEMKRECDTLKDGEPQLGACLHRYELCCVCYALLCEHHFVRFVEPDKDHSKIKILACTRYFDLNCVLPRSPMSFECSDDMYCITSDGYISSTKCVLRPTLLPTPHGPYPDKGELPWEELYFKNCKKKNYCVRLWNNHVNYWNMKSVLLDEEYMYQYTRPDFELAMIVLQAYLNDSSTGSECYGIQQFSNTTNRAQGIMTCFSKEQFPDNQYTWYEMKVTMNTEYSHTLEELFRDELEITDLRFSDIYRKQREYWLGLMSCRFVFANFNNPSQPDKTGTLFYTNNHYGHNLIAFVKPSLLQALKGIQGCQYQPQDSCYRYIRRMRITSVLHQIRSLCHHCKYDLQEVMIQKGTEMFPFDNIGTLTLTARNQHTQRGIHIIL